MDQAMGTIPRIHPVVLSGGVGSRLWPMSRALYPKQLLPLTEEKPMLAATLARTSGAQFAAPVVVCNEEHRFIVAEQLRSQNCKPAAIILEPVGRNTAPATAIAALAVLEQDPNGLMLVMPSDHVIGVPDAFMGAIQQALPAAQAGRLVTFGITPKTPETGYGYIRAGAALSSFPGVSGVDQFVEKPNLETAEGFLKQGGYFWNAGIFLFSAQSFLDELAVLGPDVLSAVQNAWTRAVQDLDFRRLDEGLFSAAPSISIDVAVMERTAKASVVPVDMGWSDVGAWPALWDISDKDAAGNVVLGDVMAVDVQGSYLRSEGGPLTAVVGLDDVVVVATDDAILVASKDHAQGVKEIVETLAAQGRTEHLAHSTVYRPWGTYRTIDHGNRFKVKQIVVYPGQTLSLQYHYHRAEHWIVVEGTARVTSGERVFLLQENESTYISAGTQHRLENPGCVPLRLIEVQSGAYLGEDDIVRLEDTYGRC
jgi:mannose-1-phosphate guanylyltransferase/mannose-6-phosphate isomerase